MIITTALQTDAMQELSTFAPQHARSVANSLSSRLIRNGAIEVESRDHLRELLTSIRSAPIGPDARRNLLLMLERLDNFGRLHIASREIKALDDWNGLVGLVLTAHGRISSEYGTSDDPFIVARPSRMEVSSSSEFESSMAFAELRRLEEQGNLALGSSRRDFWAEVLEPLATLSQKIVISDPWVFAPLQKRAGAAPGSDSWPKQALPWLLGAVDALKVGLPRSIEIYTSEKSISASDARVLSDRYLGLGSGAIGTVTVYIGSHDMVAHDRHIRFGCGSAITLGAGLDRLDRPDIRDASGLNWAFRSGSGLNNLRDSEERVKASNRTSIVPIHP